MIYFVRNDPEVGPAAYGRWLSESGVEHRVVCLDAGDELPELAPGDGAIILGGRMCADDVAGYPYLGPLVCWMKANAIAGRPQLGICLGGQLLALAIGGKLHRKRCQEVGVNRIELTEAAADDPVLGGAGAAGTSGGSGNDSGSPESLVSFSWHSDSFELPPGVAVLARTAVCPTQAFRWGESWGLQFHPEADLATVGRWLEGSDDAGRQGVPAEAILAGLAAAMPEHGKSGRAILKGFLARLGPT